MTDKFSHLWGLCYVGIPLSWGHFNKFFLIILRFEVLQFIKSLALILQSNVDPRDEVFGYQHQFEDKPSLSKSEDRKEYNIGVLRQLQVIFGHLAASRLQYYVPRGFWKQFR